MLPTRVLHVMFVSFLALSATGAVACGRGHANDPSALQSGLYAQMRIAGDRFNLKVCECRTGYCDEYYSVSAADRAEYECMQRAYDAVLPDNRYLQCMLSAQQTAARCVARLECVAAPIEACMDAHWAAEEECPAPTEEQATRMNDIASVCMGRPAVAYDPRARSRDVDE